MNGTELARHQRNINVLNQMRDKSRPYLPATVKDYQLLIIDSRQKDIEIDRLENEVKDLKAKLARFGVEDE